MAIAPSSWAGVLAKAPLNEPTAVRAAPTMTMFVMGSSSGLFVDTQHRRARDDQRRPSTDNVWQSSNPRPRSCLSVELNTGFGPACQHARGRIERHLRRPMKRPLMHRVERLVHQAGQQAFDEEVFAPDKAHEITDGAVLPKRDQRTEVAVAEWLQRLALEAPLDLLDEMGRLLMGGLRAWRDWRGQVRRDEIGAVPNCKDVGIPRRM